MIRGEVAARFEDAVRALLQTPPPPGDAWKPEGEEAEEAEGSEEAVSDDRPLSAPVRWLAVGMNVALLFTEGVLLSQRGVTTEEIPMVSLLVATPILNPALFLGYNRRGL